LLTGIHPFIDGNKRTGLVTAALFLENNGVELTAPEAEAVLLTHGLAAGEIDQATYAQWLKDGSQPQ
jgi:death-on-curing protein